MRLGISHGKQTVEEIDGRKLPRYEYDRAVCCLCSARYVNDPLADERLKEHLQYEHSRTLVSRDMTSKAGKVTITYSGPYWINNTEDGITPVKRR